jgi:hypothetical protein
MMKRARTSKPLEHDEVVWRLLILNGASEGEETKEDGWNAAEELFIVGYALHWSESGYTATKYGETITCWGYRDPQQIIKWMQRHQSEKEPRTFKYPFHQPPEESHEPS